jgi:GDP-L-fucose synthase
MNKKNLLLGANGFVGTNVCEYFTGKGISFDKSSGSQHDLRNIDDARALIREFSPDYIINCAAHVGSLNYVTENAADVLLDNTRMILNLYQALSELRKETIVINPIANCAYPANSDTFIEDQWMNGHLHRSVLSYGATRRMLWHTGESFYMQHGIKSIYLLVPNMYGPNDSTDPNKAHALNALISKFVKAKKEGKNEIEIWGTGIAIREWLYAKDFARILELIISGKISIGLDEPVNIGQNFGLSIRELVTVINSKYDNKFNVFWNHKMPDGAPKKVMDDVKFRHTFRDFEFTNFNEGIEKTINYYESIYPY